MSLKEQVTKKVVKDPTWQERIDRFDRRVTEWMADHGIGFLRISLGIVFLWFGALKLFPGASPAEGLVFETLDWMPISMDFFMKFLAVWEMAIGVGFLINRYMRLTILLLFLQMPGALSPTVLNPDAVWNTFPFELTLEGQYIVKNLVLISAGLVVGATVRGGYLEDEPKKEAHD
jgi:uncharacterized membrane protein YkgB